MILTHLAIPESNEAVKSSGCTSKRTQRPAGRGSPEPKLEQPVCPKEYIRTQRLFFKKSMC